jgi:creatinine amidohydrolase
MAPADHGMQTPRLTHACEYETSMILALRPDLVKLAQLDPAHLEKPRPWTVDPRWSGKVEGFHRFHRWTSSGHMGRPDFATREKGLSLLSAISDAVSDFLIDFSTWPLMPPLPAKTESAS